MGIYYGIWLQRCWRVSGANEGGGRLCKMNNRKPTPPLGWKPLHPKCRLAGLQGSTIGGGRKPMSQHCQVTAIATVAVITVHMTGVSTRADVVTVPCAAASSIRWGGFRKLFFLFFPPFGFLKALPLVGPNCRPFPRNDVNRVSASYKTEHNIQKVWIRALGFGNHKRYTRALFSVEHEFQSSSNHAWGDEWQLKFEQWNL